MKTFLLGIFLSVTVCASAQETSTNKSYDQHGVVWSAGLFKSWLTDTSVDFHQVGSTITPVYAVEKKQGISLLSHYMYKPHRLWGVGIHLGLGLDVVSYIEAPVLLFGGSLSYGSEHQFILTFGWADAERRIVRGSTRAMIDGVPLAEPPNIVQETEHNTALYLGISYRL